MIYQKKIKVSRLAKVGYGWKRSTVPSFLKVCVLKSSSRQSRSDMIKYMTDDKTIL